MDTAAGPVLTSLEAVGCGKRLSMATSVVDPEPGDSYMVEGADDPRALLGQLRVRAVDLAGKFRSEIADLQGRLEGLEEQIRKIDAALSAFDEPLAKGEPLPNRRLTIKQGVLQVLRRAAPQGLSANEIRSRLQTELGMDYERTSLSPQLSRLGAAGQIRLEQGRWFLAAKENGSEA